MIVKMNLISLTGPVQDIDRVVNTYVSKYEIHLENALTELGNVQNLVPFKELNPYREPLQKISDYAELLRTAGITEGSGAVDAKTASDLAERLDHEMEALKAQKACLLSEIKELEKRANALEPFRSLPTDIRKLLGYKFVEFRFGRIPKDFYHKLKDYVYDNFDTVFYPCQKDEGYVWGVYFVPRNEAHKIDAVYSSMHFERLYIPAECEGTPEEGYQSALRMIEEKKQEIARVEEEMLSILKKDGPILLASQEHLERLSENFDVRKYAARALHKNDEYYILCGWMAEDDVKKLMKEIADDDMVVCVVEDIDAKDQSLVPPTKLKNPKLFQPYEMYVEMYGLPNYRELDPTLFIALTYSFIFGAMYGDLGQGLCLLIGGFLLYHFKHIRLAGIISCAGLFSSIFGLLFGSFFGFEGVLFEPIWLLPKVDKMTLPGIGSINTVLVCAVVFGMFLILVSMIFNIINSKRLGDRENMLFGTNSITGFVFYLGVTIAVFTAFGAGNMKIGALFIVIFFVLPLILMFFKEPLTNKLNQKKELIEGGTGMFLVQGFFEMFETMLSFFSNTLSFVRIGAFAVSHAAMMEVVLMLAGAEAGTPNWLVVVLGNLFVMGMEGLIVGIQVLRLEYYEMFSRFYHGDGRAFTPFFKKKSS